MQYATMVMDVMMVAMRRTGAKGPRGVSQCWYLVWLSVTFMICCLVTITVYLKFCVLFYS